ncbi:hypothetical protein ODZ83_10525 [Acaricomes phytoseiuli]|uniref:hypothetical protein n=1 Tax=Acaricomes phytoseiuli TaxID=291968 RepID=UPI0022239F83|nr:hypothetical protein [Acaricomes phytoseiuli]MCW1250602.1 hypothetical protein [Acaricomes phytoseiuli]
MESLLEVIAELPRCVGEAVDGLVDVGGSAHSAGAVCFWGEFFGCSAEVFAEVF